ncbi:hypothetical protein IGI37_001905 [Enterococcus sp. AZ194]|uniref:YxeA family protein n=1 Tax=Enterococcus sp. AZ194 TaxID=2774629 RepID=UPI003F25B93F
MKKILGSFLILLMVVFGSWLTYSYFYGGETYYTQIVTDGEKESEQSDGETFTKYIYQQTAYNKNGKETQILLNAYRTRPLRLKAYLKLKINPRKGLMEWEEVPQSEVAEKALNKLG